MVNKQNFFRPIGIAAVSISLIFIVVALLAGNKSKYCYSMLSPVPANSNESSRILESGCYDTFAESIKAATGGRVQLDPSIQPKDVTDGMLNSDNSSW